MSPYFGPAGWQKTGPTITTTRLLDGEYVGFRIHINNGDTLKVFTVGVQNTQNNAPAGLTVYIYNETASTVVYDKNVKRDTGRPLLSIDGAADVLLAERNETGSVQNATAYFEIGT